MVWEDGGGNPASYPIVLAFGFVSFVLTWTLLERREWTSILVVAVDHQETFAFLAMEAEPCCWIARGPL